jgi:hypothetical protein
VKPKILVATTSRWYPTARFAMALAKVGFVVDAVCPSRHPMLKTNAVESAYSYHGLFPLVSFANAISRANPDLIVPGDDLAAQHLHCIYEREARRRGAESPICAIIERSLGSHQSFPIVYSRTAFMDTARGEGIRVPQTAAIDDVEQLGSWIAQVGLPAVLKANGTSGGDGVRIVHTPQEAEQAFRELQAPPLFTRAAKRTLLNQDAALLRPALLQQRFLMNVQEFVRGTEATSAVACWDGNILASLHFEVVNKRNTAGPSTVVRLIDNPEMVAATKKMARRMNLSGVHGFDFMLETGSRNAYLIEINPRSTQVGHLALGPGRDIPAALHSAVSGKPLSVTTPVTEKDTVALFPQEWMRDSASPYIRSAFHDVPWDEPELIRACIRSGKKQRSRREQKEAVRTLHAMGVPHR